MTAEEQKATLTKLVTCSHCGKAPAEVTQPDIRPVVQNAVDKMLSPPENGFSTQRQGDFITVVPTKQPAQEPVAWPTAEQYDEAIRALQDGKTQLKPDGNNCHVCGDGGHQAFQCPHNPLVVSHQVIESRNVWRCFHCGAVFTKAEDAKEHFGETEKEVARCLAAPLADKAEALLAAAKQMLELIQECNVEIAVVITPEIRKWLPRWKEAIQQAEAGQ